MKILKRYKDANGSIVGYDILAEGTVSRFSLEQALSLQQYIDNAFITSGGEYRAKSGCKIDTEVLHKNQLIVRPVAKPIEKPRTQSMPLDYYGKEFISVCRKLRSYAQSNNFVVDMNKHKSNYGKNTHLFKLIEACGVNVHDFIQNYLYNIQPYSLSRFQSKKNPGKGNIWLSDMGYNIQLVIKVYDVDPKRPIVLSFHESNKNGKQMKGGVDFSDKPCAVLLDNARQASDTLFAVDYIVQRGFITAKIHSLTKYYNNDVALVDYSDIKEIFMQSVQQLIQQLQSNYYFEESSSLNLNVSSVTFEGISFMSFGYATVNNICLLIDIFSRYRDTKSKQAVSEIAMCLLSEVSNSKLNEIKAALAERYLGSENKLYLAIKDMEE